MTATTTIQKIQAFEIEGLGAVNISYSFDEENDTYNPLGEDGTPEVTDTNQSNFCITKMEVEIMGASFLINGKFKDKLGRIKYNKLIDALENASS